MGRWMVLGLALIVGPSTAMAQKSDYVPLPPGTRCVVVNTTNTGNINLTCNMARVHENGIRQGGYEVGLGEGFSQPSPDLAVFSRLSGDGDFKPDSDFIYNGLTLHMVGSNGNSFDDMNGAKRIAFWNARCRVVKAVPPHP